MKNRESMIGVNENGFNKNKVGLTALAGLAAVGLGYYAYTRTAPPAKKEVLKKLYEGLDKETAKARRLTINGDVHYNLYMIFQEKTSNYHGRVEIVFKTKNRKDVLIDYCGNILGMTINGKQVTSTYWLKKDIYDGFLLKVKAEQLNSDSENKVVIDFESSFSTDLDGLTKTEYPIEGSDDVETYIYGWNELYAAQKCFPHFNQPNIRGT